MGILEAILIITAFVVCLPVIVPVFAFLASIALAVIIVSLPVILVLFLAGASIVHG